MDGIVAFEGINAANKSKDVRRISPVVFFFQFDLKEKRTGENVVKLWSQNLEAHIFSLAFSF